MDSFQLEVLSPAGMAAQATVSEVVLPAWNGEVGVLPHHVAYTGLLGTGVLRFRNPTATGNKDEQSIVVSEGFCVFESGVLKVLADQVLLPEAFATTHGGRQAALSYARSRCSELEANRSTMDSSSHEWSDMNQEISRLRAMERCLS